MMNQNRKPVVEALEKFQASRPISFHVPGHKHGMLSNLPLGMKEALRYDVTELAGLDDLHAPTEILAEAQMLLADTYGAECSYFLVNGSTVGNLAMIRTICEPGDTLLVQRNAHKSVFHAMELAGAHAVLLTPEWDERTCTAGAVSLATVKDALDKHPEAKGVFITYPTYYGTTGTELSQITESAHEQNIPVLVDEAHGAHFVAGAPFPPSALDLGVDITVQSAHKTLSAMTQASFLHVKSDLVDVTRLARLLSMLQTSSPSYLLLASLDDARELIANYSEGDKQEFLTWRQVFIQQLNKIETLEVIETEDPLKILLRQKEASGYKLQQTLEQGGIYTELADERQVLFVLPLVVKNESYPIESICKDIATAVKNMKVESSQPSKTDESFNESSHKLVITTSSQPKKDTQWVVCELAIGRQAASPIIPYPPGIPLVLNGELLNEQQVQDIRRMLEAGAKFQGGVKSDGHTIEFEVLNVQGEDVHD
ncbi:aminotransferase class I/II-fold pyridoxal phosphate-dependent enzyme [Sporosarcina aquimarina]|uniref:Aminotransferase class I/II-fold pyridoxal phosphate-dependent enzyme n=1 Tax=Sporosarcina aquimarina TaxID=114975 RepID=A0ABU4G4X8_9BACL|nr:aminotransferase class I/II-fold pyridoxal phosphate-dependent enzyme [Sporosarcina aquimarina]MDW0111383.1 aminotransferase class I/II-fold pyridoxal phosphate-dependent enzyme [Sporosarcina aquimarina]